MTTIRDKVLHRLAAEDDGEFLEDVGELEISEYIVFLLALDTYSRYIEEVEGLDTADDLVRKGIHLVRRADRRYQESMVAFLEGNLPTASQKKMLGRAFRFKPNPQGLSKRTYYLRTVMSRGGATTMRAVFKKNLALRKVREAMEASMMDDADAALDKFHAIQMRNPLLRKWIKEAADTAGSGTYQNAVTISSDEGSDEVEPILAARTKQQGGSATSDQSQEAGAAKDDLITSVQEKATEAAVGAMEVSGEPDEPPKKSEVMGLAAAAAVSAVTDPANPNNIPSPLRKLDDEQRAAALTDGRVLVAAGAGSGKSTTVVARVEYLIKDKRVNPSRVMVTSFNTKAASELKQKIGVSAGADALSQMSVGTMHSLFRKFIGEYGTAQERSAMGVGKSKGGFVQGGVAVARVVQRIWADCYGNEENGGKKAPKLKNVMMFKSKWAGNNITPQEAKEQANSEEEADAALWYEMYEGLKGAIPGWKPSCGRSKAYESFMGRWRSNGERLGDFDDMLGIFDDILKREPVVRKTLQGMFDHIIVDEAQDLSGVQFSIISQISDHVTDGKDGKSLWIVGDDKQCVADTTPISTPTGTTLARELREGDEVLAYRNGTVLSQRIRHVAPSSWTSGFKVTTESGASLTLSPNHKIWAQGPILEEDQVAVYLMYRRDMGFRVGITNKCHDDEYLNSFGGRAFMEKAERMWILDVCKDREEALLEETSYSLQYGVPTMVFEGTNRGVNQERVAALFDAFGKNGGRILEAKHLNFDLPHWVSQSYTKHGRDRRTVQMSAHGPKGSQVTLEWSGSDLDDKLDGIHFKVIANNRRRLRKGFANYRDALSFAEEVQRRTGANLSRRLSTSEGAIRLITGSGVFPGMKVAVQEGDGIVLETVTDVKETPGTFLDLDVDDASNFFGGGILSHNSIYAFRGARPDLFTKLNETDGWNTQMIRTNYRCQPEIVDSANKLIAHNEDQIPMEAVPASFKSRGVASVRVETAEDEASAALNVVEEIKSNISADGEVTDNAILTRTNKEQHAFETACIIRGVPYARKGASSFLGSPETKAFLSYVQLATGSDYSKMQVALGEVINKPNRFFVGPDQGSAAVQDALSAYAKRTNQNIKDLHPLNAMGNDQFLETLAEKLTRSRSGFKFRKAIEKLQDLQNDVNQMRINSEDENYTTKDMFDDILNMRGTTAVTNTITGRAEYVEQTFRDSLKADLRDRTDDDADTEEEDDSEEHAGLGNISFLYELAKPDPTDPEDTLSDPKTPMGFKNKMERYAKKARELRIDISKWEKEQATLPPDQRKAPPGVYLGTAHCSPADEMIHTVSGWVAIGDLDPKIHRLTSYASSCNQLFWGYAKGDHANLTGYEFVKKVMPYKGKLHTLVTDKSKTRLTPDHRIRVKWSDSFYNKYVVYLMKRGDWWRVGMTKSANRPYGGSDFKTRVSAEKADACWILSVHHTRSEAVLEEARIQAYYGLTGLTFESSHSRKVTTEQVQTVHESVKGISKERATSLLTDYNFDANYPLYTGKGRVCDMRSAFTIRASNCLSGYMLLPVVSDGFLDQSTRREEWTKPEWHEVTVTTEDFEGDVYSLVVPPHHYYISGGAIVHNSTKGAQWKNCYVSMPKGKFPFEPPQRPGAPPKDPEVAKEEMEAERRLGYVALTRAAMNLTIVCPTQVGGKAAGVSPFVDEAGLRVGENVLKPGAETIDDEDPGSVKMASFEYDGVIPDDWEESKDWSV